MEEVFQRKGLKSGLSLNRMVKNPYTIMVRDETNLFGSSKKKRTPVKKGVRDKVWFKYMKNKTQGKCYCCRIIPIHFTNFEVGHNKSVYAGGTNHINNLRPICRSCNHEMGTKSIEWYKKKYYEEPTSKTKGKTTKKGKKGTTGKGDSRPIWINPITSKKERFDPMRI